MAQELKVVIATAGRSELLRRTLDSLALCRKPGIYREAVVIENGPRADVERTVNEYADTLAARYVYVERANKSHALNRVLEKIDDACLVFFTDDDVRFSPDVLMHYARVAEGVDGGEFYGGPTRADYEKPPPRWLLKALPPSVRGWTAQDDPADAVPVFLGFNWAAFTGDVRQAGLFDPAVGPGGTTGALGQESRMQRQLIESGVQPCYVPDALVWHYVPAERCTPQWAIERAYRNGVQHGLNHASKPYSLRRALRQIAKRFKGLGLLAAASLSHAPQTQFRADHTFAYLRGRREGRRIARADGRTMASASAGNLTFSSIQPHDADV